MQTWNELKICMIQESFANGVPKGSSGEDSGNLSVFELTCLALKTIFSPCFTENKTGHMTISVRKMIPGLIQGGLSFLFIKKWSSKVKIARFQFKDTKSDIHWRSLTKRLLEKGGSDRIKAVWIKIKQDCLTLSSVCRSQPGPISTVGFPLKPPSKSRLGLFLRVSYYRVNTVGSIFF